MLLRIGDETIDADPDLILNTEAIAVEKATGLTFADWMDGLDAGDTTAITALVWIGRRRVDPKVRFGDVQYPVRLARWENTPEENRRILANIDAELATLRRDVEILRTNSEPPPEVDDQVADLDAKIAAGEAAADDVRGRLGGEAEQPPPKAQDSGTEPAPGASG